MYKSFLFFLLLFVAIIDLNAQDIIITKKGDTVVCEITKITERFIHFDYRVDVQTRSSLMELNRIQSYQKGGAPDVKKKQVYQQEYRAPETSYKKPNISSVVENTEPKQRKNYLKANVAYGLAYFIAPATEGLIPQLEEYETDLRSGSSLGLGLTYFPQSNMGFGVRYQNMRTSAEVEFFVLDPNTFRQIFITLRDDIAIDYYGPQFTLQSKIDQFSKSTFFATFTLGYMNYRNDGFINDGVNFINEEIILEGGNIGGGFDMGINLAIADGIYFDLNASLLFGLLNEVKANGQTVRLSSDETINISFFTLGAGISIDIN